MGLSGRKLILLHLLKVLAGYARCLPGLCNAARFKAWHLLPQVIAPWTSTARCNRHLAERPNSLSIKIAMTKEREVMCANDSILCTSMMQSGSAYCALM